MIAISVLSLFVLQLPLSAKRLPPKLVNPVISGGIEYSSHGDGEIGWITATDLASGRQLWTVRVFRIHTHWWKGEEDNQLIFISDLKLDHSALLIRDEQSRCYRIDLTKKRLRAERCRQ